MTQVWHEFIIYYCNKAKTIEKREETPTRFINAMEEYLLSLV
jgi:hypothetical protein